MLNTGRDPRSGACTSAALDGDGEAAPMSGCCPSEITGRRFRFGSEPDHD